MKQNLLKSLMTMALLAGVYVMAMAQTIYGVRNGIFSEAVMCSFELSEVNAETAAQVTDIASESEQCQNGIQTGTTLGSIYYGFYGNEDYDNCLGSFNFTTGEGVCVKVYDENPLVGDMTSYDGKLYGLRASADYYQDPIVYIAEIVEINVATGQITPVYSFEGYEANYDALTSDGKGGFYWVHNVPNGWYNRFINLYHVDAEGTLTKVIEQEDAEDAVTAPNSYNNSLVALEDGSLVYVGNTDVFVIDPTAKTIVNKGKLKNSLVGLTLTKSSENAVAAAEPKVETRKLVRSTKYGDHMGTTEASTQQIEYYYDKDLKTSRVSTLGRQNDKFPFELSYYTKYTYDDNGNILSEVRYQTGLYDLGDVALDKRSEITYVYNEKGQKVEKHEVTYSNGSASSERPVVYYTYDEDGNLYTESYAVLNNTETVVITYLAYENGKPTAISTVSPWENTVEMFQYDENGNVLGSMTIDNTADPETGMPSMKALKGEQWEYDETGFLTSVTKYYFDQESGEPVPTDRTTYEAVDGDQDKVKHYDQTYFDGEWYGTGTYFIDDYLDFKGNTKSTSTTLTVVPLEGGEKNSVRLVFSVPEAAYTNSCAINIYRNGELIKSDDLFNYELSEDYDLLYTDERVPNGEYDYFVQTGVGAYAPFMDEPETSGDDYTYYCVSNVADYTFDTKLPVVTDLAVAGAAKDVYSDPMTGATSEALKATLSWKNPEDAADYGFISNSVYATGMQLSEAETKDAAADNIDFFVFKDMEVYVCTRYELGKAISEPISIKLKDLEVLTGIEKVTESGIGVQITGKVLNMNGVANVSVFALNGQTAAKANAVSSLDMSALKNGTYVVAIEKDGKVSTYKVILK